MFNVDSHKSITVGGLKLTSTLIETLLCRKFQGTNHFNTKVHLEDLFNPFLSHNQLIPPAKYDVGLYKTPMVNLGKAINFLHGIEHAMIHGFLKAPKNVELNSYVQPVNYFDKSNIQMHKVNTIEYVKCKY
jgi:hypothetical protein